MSPSAERSIRRRAAVARGYTTSRRGDVLVSQAQRTRMLRSAAQVVTEHGYSRMSVARITALAGVSRRTFYDLFEDREDCFLEVFGEAVARAQAQMASAYLQARGWQQQTRAALLALLLLLDGEPGLRSLLIVEPLKAGPRVQQHRAEILADLSSALHQGGARAGRSGVPPALTGEGVVGAVFSVIHTRLLVERPSPLVELLGPLMGLIVAPYLGPAAANRELKRPAAVTRDPRTGARGQGEDERRVAHDPLAGLPMRITYRTLRVLGVLARAPGASNREIAEQAGVADQGQISKLLGRLDRLGLIHNGGPGQPSGEPNAWQLTARGLQVQRAMQPRPNDGNPRIGGSGEPDCGRTAAKGSAHQATTARESD